MCKKKKKKKLQRAITHEIFFRIYTEVNRVTYSSLPINSPSFKSLARTVFEILCWQGKNAQNYNSRSIFQNLFKSKSGCLLITISLFIKALAPTVFEIFCWQGKNAKNYKGPLLMKYFSEFIKKLIRSSTQYYNPFTKFQGSSSNSFWDILLTR